MSVGAARVSSAMASDPPDLCVVGWADGVNEAGTDGAKVEGTPVKTVQARVPEKILRAGGVPVKPLQSRGSRRTNKIGDSDPGFSHLRTDDLHEVAIPRNNVISDIVPCCREGWQRRDVGDRGLHDAASGPGCTRCTDLGKKCLVGGVGNGVSSARQDTHVGAACAGYNVIRGVGGAACVSSPEGEPLTGSATWHRLHQRKRKASHSLLRIRFAAA